jgi:hypothetical protein
MAYFGNTPLQSTYLTDYLSGDNSTVAFTLARAPISAQSVLVHISGVKQHASTYGVSGTTLTFSEAPPTGTNNIEVLHLGISPETVTLPSYRTITEFTATAGQTSFSPASYTVGYIDVYRNGVKLGTADFTASNGTTVVLTAGCTDGDLVRFEGFLITAFNDAIPNTAGAVGSSLLASGSALANIGAAGVTQSYIGNNVAGTGPAFSAYQSSAQTISTGVTTKLQFQTKEFDTANCFDNVTNYRFTPNVAGYYQVSGGLQLATSACVLTMYFHKNGSAYKQFLSTNSANVSGGYGSVLVYLNGTTDYVELYAHLSTGQALNAQSYYVYFQGAMVRAA